MDKENVDLEKLYERAGELSELVKKSEAILEGYVSQTDLGALTGAMKRAAETFKKEVIDSGRLAKQGAKHIIRGDSIEEWALSAIAVGVTYLFDFIRELNGEKLDRAARRKVAEALLEVYQELISKQRMILVMQEKRSKEIQKWVEKLTQDTLRDRAEIERLTEQICKYEEQLGLYLDIQAFSDSIQA